MPTPSVIDRTCKWPDKCQAISTKGCQCANNPYTGESEENYNPAENHKPRFCYQHRKPLSRKYGEVINPTQAVNMNSQAYQSSIGNVEEDANLCPPPLQFHNALAVPSQVQHFGNDFAFKPSHQSNQDQASHQSNQDFAFNPSHQSNQDQGPLSPRTSSDVNMHTGRRQSKDKGPAINESQALQSLTAQLDRIELRGQRLEISCASKANVESLEIRVQHLEKAAGLPESDQMLGSHDEAVTKINSTLSEHLAAIQEQYDFVCVQRDEAGRRADGLHRSSESARRMFTSTLQKYHENNREHKLRGEQAQYLEGLKQGIEARMESITKSEPISPSHIMEEEL